MAITIKKIEYFYTTVEDKHGKGYWMLEHFRQKGVNLVAFTAFPRGAGRSQMDFVPDDAEKLKAAAAEADVSLVGPKRAFLIQGEDEIGAIVELHFKLTNAGINVHAANGVSDGTGQFGYILWVKPEDFDAAARVFGV
jgi:hypothetical protein